MQFMIVAYDGQDEGALNRRLAARESHIAGAIALKNAGHLIAGGAILDDAGAWSDRLRMSTSRHAPI
jgi:uncharacterized protein YciI